MAIGDLDVAPAFERCKHHEDVGGAVALVLVIAAGRTSPLHRDRQARLGKELLGGLVQAHQRGIGIAWPCVDRQHIFHGGYERAIGLRRDDPALVSSLLMNRLVLHPSPASDTSAFNNIRAFSRRWAAVLALRISASNCSRSSTLSRTTYFFTEISFAAMIASVACNATKANRKIRILAN